MTLHDIWIDPVWSKVIGGLIVIVITGVSRLVKWPKLFWKPALRRFNVVLSFLTILNFGF